MKKILIFMFCLMLIGGVAFAEAKTPGEFLTEKGYTVVETNAGEDDDVNAYTFCGLAFSTQSGNHGFFWIDKNGAAYTARNAGEAFTNAFRPALGHLGAIGTFVEMCRTFGFDLGVYTRDSDICFGLSVDSEPLRNLANNLCEGQTAKLIVGWDEFEKYLMLFG